MHTMQEMEVRLRRLEVELEDVKRRLLAAQHKLGQVAEDNARQFPDDNAGRIFVWAQSVGVIAGLVGNTLGTGTARLLQLQDGKLYKWQPLVLGDITVPVVNGTGSPTINNEVLLLAVVEGRWTCILGDCATAAPAVAPDPPPPTP